LEGKLQTHTMHRGAAQVVGGAPAMHMPHELMSALIHGDFDRVQRIVTKHPKSVNSKDVVSMAQTIPDVVLSLVCCAVVHGSLTPSVTCFSGLQDKPGNSPLHHAVMGDFVSIVKMLIKAGADVNAADNVGVIFPVRCIASVYSR
jgi:hypothetical protein